MRKLLKMTKKLTKKRRLLGFGFTKQTAFTRSKSPPFNPPLLLIGFQTYPFLTFSPLSTDIIFYYTWYYYYIITHTCSVSLSWPPFHFLDFWVFNLYTYYTSWAFIHLINLNLFFFQLGCFIFDKDCIFLIKNLVVKSILVFLNPSLNLFPSFSLFSFWVYHILYIHTLMYVCFSSWFLILEPICVFLFLLLKFESLVQLGFCASVWVLNLRNFCWGFDFDVKNASSRFSRLISISY